MLADAVLVTILPAVDLRRAKEFYTEKIGLKISEESPKGLVFESENGGPDLYIYKRGPTKADHTVAGFIVKDVEKEVKELKERGVVFEEYNTPETKTVNSIASKDKGKSAWFKDTEGNIIAIASM